MAGHAALRERIERICADADDDRALRLRLLAVLHRSLGFDAYAWVLTDPRTRVGGAPLADVPCLPELPQLIRLRYLTRLNRWTGLAPDPVALLSSATGGDLGRSELWRELLCRHDVADVASVVFRDAWGCWAFLELWRTGGRVFGADDAAVLRAVVPCVTTALRRSQARTFAGPPPPGPPPGPLVLLLSPDLRSVRATPGTEEALRRLVPRDDAGPPVPAGAYNVAAQLLAVEAAVDDAPPEARVHLAAGRWLVLRAARVGDPVAGDIAVTVDEAGPVDRLDLYVRCAGLSPREVELVGHLAAGADTREVAGRMCISRHTVQDHLKSVFDKTGVRSRRTLLARAAGR
ncbi:response regulator transcription factor [Trujillonella endophytica]|uniref:DNA-binding transcriptional regulator, CsgD family n=1 Tax=Trujillonella endophytica TaxID=673521 RepID=A0A1H8TJ69_9ACTN|nr:helix-turn-helix transcriptional regulator [Trujillella endophytica]SEO91120.1 DNA-binding transcriptional regulator, CsgD family [Trujillella endophytica]